MTSELYVATPDPARITESLRDTGYVLNTAIADIVDNSIAAGANKVHIEFKLDPRGRVRFSITDNGEGMDRDGLVNALRYGSQRRDDPSSLGKFGLGLKTASTAFAKRIRVTSRKEGGPVSSAIWDLDRVKDIGWQVEITSDVKADDLKRLDHVAPNGASGSVVRWENIDRVIRKYQDPTGQYARKAIANVVEKLEEHLSLVFQRFLDEDDNRAENVEFFLNDQKVVAWNPFGFDAECIFEDITPVEGPDGTAVSELSLRAFVLPRRQELLSKYGPEAPREARLKNKYQGIYVYRENRLIHGPDWLGFWTQEPHSTLARVELSFDFRLDESFKIDIKKSRIQLDDAIADYLSKALAGPRSVSQQIYREGRASKPETQTEKSLHKESNATIESKQGAIPKPSLNSTDGESGTAVITNPQGTITVPWSPSDDKTVYVETVDFVEDGMLYQPAYIEKNIGVRLNKTHPYYQKVYLANQEKPATIQALDSLLWALSTAELNVTDDTIRRTFSTMRYDISRTLRLLVEDLPDFDDNEE